MKATHTYTKTGQPVTHIKVEFNVTSKEIEIAVGTCMLMNDRITKEAIIRRVRANFFQGGYDQDFEWVPNDIDYTKAVSIARRYFPDFYTK
jgi:hypothetical protein